MSEEDKVKGLALSLIKGMNLAILQKMEDCGVSIDEFFEKETTELSFVLSLSRHLDFSKEKREEALDRAFNLYESMKRRNVFPLFILDEEYPSRLASIPDAPLVIYKIGKGSLNGQHIVSIVGTRKPTPYGIEFCKRIIEDLGAYFPDLCVVSGMAYGIDAASHQASLERGLQTVGVMAHGLDMIYPANHRDLARKIIKNNGTLISEYPFGEKPYRQRFLERNRIIAALPDVTIVVESDLKGGAMSTANLAFSYSRDVMAVPGRISDTLSAGCNRLIRSQKAYLLTSAADLIETTGWKPLDLKVTSQNRNLFPELEGDMKVIYDVLRFSQEPLQLDKLHSLTGISVSKLMSELGELEFEGIIIRYPGNRFSIA